MQTAKEEILGRVREALRAKAPAPGRHDAHRAVSPPAAPGNAEFKAWLPPVGPTFEEQRDLFAKNADLLKAAFRVVPSVEAAADTVREIIIQGQWKRAASHHSDLTDAMCKHLPVPVLWTDGGYDLPALEQCDGGITVCEALVAQTGTVVITSQSCGGRALSVLPHHHIVVAIRDQMVPDLTAAFALLRQKYDGNYPSTMSLITGPSRTGDIERILVLGAHGPKQLTILLVDR